MSLFRALAMLLILFALTTIQATTYKQLSLDELLAKADIAFYGIVISVDPIDRNGELWTQVSYELLEPLKGLGEDAAALELLFYGGIPLDGAAFQVSLMPQFSVGETVLILAYQADYFSPIVGFRQGLWREQDSAFISETGQRLSLGEEGDLHLEGAGANPQDILTAMRAAFEAQE